MLVLSRKIGQQIQIGDQITLTIVKTQGQTVRVGIQAPRDVRIVRAELPPLVHETNTTPATDRESASQTKPTRSLSLLSAESPRPQRLPGKDAANGQRHTQPSHPQRWTVANMRERVQTQTSPRSTPTDTIGQYV